MMKKSITKIQSHGAVTKAIALAVAFVFTCTSVTWADPAAASKTSLVAPAPVGDLALDLGKVSLPAEMGKIVETYRGTGDKTVVLVQDAHSIPDAQRSIRSVLEFFQKSYGVSTVGLEGAASELDAQIFKSFPDKERLERTFDQYAARGELTGGSAAAIFSKAPAEYHGIEDWKLYEQGIALYLAATKAGEAAGQQLAEEEMKLEGEKATVYSKELLEVDRALRDFEANKIDLAALLVSLNRYLAPTAGSELAVLTAEVDREGVSDIPVETEIKEIANKAEAFLKADPSTAGDFKTLNGKVQEFRTAQITPQAFALYLKEIVKRHGIKVKVSAKLARLVQDQKLLRDIEGTKLFGDLKRYEDQVKASLMRPTDTPGVDRVEAMRELDRRSRGLDLLKRLAKLELSFEDWTIVKRSTVNGQRTLPVWNIGVATATHREWIGLNNCRSIPFCSAGLKRTSSSTAWPNSATPPSSKISRL